MSESRPRFSPAVFEPRRAAIGFDLTRSRFVYTVGHFARSGRIGPEPCNGYSRSFQLYKGVDVADSLVFDSGQLFAATCDDKELAEQIVAVFLADTPTQLTELDKALDDGDVGTAERIAHTLKGSSATIGGENLRAAAYECEKLGHAGDLAGLRERTRALRDHFDALRAALIEEGFANA